MEKTVFFIHCNEYETFIFRVFLQRQRKDFHTFFSFVAANNVFHEIYAHREEERLNYSGSVGRGGVYVSKNGGAHVNRVVVQSTMY